MKTTQIMKKLIAGLFLLLFSGSVWAANIQITVNPVIYERNIADNEIIVRFSLSWDNSWKLNSPPNHDAAWIFMKYRPLGQHGFRHANLHPVPHIVHGEDGAGAGSTRHNVRYGASDRLNDTPVYTGVFLSRSEISVGSNTFNNVKLHWDIYGTGIDENTVLSVRVFAIEMVYIPMGTFASIHTMLETGAINTIAGTAPGGVARIVYTQAIHDAIANNPHWPLGTQPFYIMKHEVSQHAWVDFLNSLTLEQQLTLSHINPTAPNNTRFGAIHNGAPFNAAPFNILGRAFINPAGTGFQQTPFDFRHARMNIRIRQQARGNTPAVFGVNASQEDVGPTATPPGGWDFETQGGNLPMFGLAWTDVMAYLDWAGLRPLTELEYEKAARGTGQVVQGEFAWGTNTWLANQSFDNRNRPDEVSGTPNANVALVSVTNASATAHDGGTFARWPIRVGAFARETTTRIEAGASFWGVLNLSDNVAEQFIRFDDAPGQAFRGTHGDGNLTGEGLADVPDWPGVIASTTRNPATTGILNDAWAAGTIFRGMGSQHNNHNIWMVWVSDRTFTNNNNWRNPWAGARGGRSVPVEFNILAHPSVTPRATNVVNAASHAQGTVPVPWAAATHTLRISAVGGAPPYTIQWYWTDQEPAGGELPATGTAIDGAMATSFLPPFNVAHGPRFFFARVTDSEGEVRTTRVSGMHTVLGVETHPSTEAVTTSLTQGTNVLTVVPAGGTPPFTVEWFVIPNGTPNAQGGGGTFVGNAPTALEHRPIIPIWLAGSHYTYWAQITDARGVVIRTLQSGPHSAGVITEGGNRNVWFGPGNQENAFPDPLNNPQSQAGANVNAADWIFEAELQPGVFRLEAWGGSGGRGGHRSGAVNNHGSLAQRTHGHSAWGGYTQTYIRVEDPMTLYIVPGGSGVHGHFEHIAVPARPALPGVRTLGGFNGGGQGGSPFTLNMAQTTSAGGGGGATHIAFVPGLLTESSVRNNILLVAGGGGGGGHSSSGGWSGSAGHTQPGVEWIHGSGAGGTATLGGPGGRWHWTPLENQFLQPQPGTAGRGGDGAVAQQANHPMFSGGGGGGWFGGGGGAEQQHHSIGGGGGSGYIALPFRHNLGDVHPGAPASGIHGNLSNPATGNIHQPGTATMATTTPQHPQGAQNHTFVRGGAVRILRLQ